MISLSHVKRRLGQYGALWLFGFFGALAIILGGMAFAADKPLAEARTLWSQAFDALTRVATLESALEAVKAAPGEDDTFRRLKAERDALRRAIKTGSIWDLSAGR